MGNKKECKRLKETNHKKKLCGTSMRVTDLVIHKLAELQYGLRSVEGISRELCKQHGRKLDHPT